MLVGSALLLVVCLCYRAVVGCVFAFVFVCGVLCVLCVCLLLFCVWPVVVRVLVSCCCLCWLWFRVVAGVALFFSSAVRVSVFVVFFGGVVVRVLCCFLLLFCVRFRFVCVAVRVLGV